MQRKLKDLKKGERAVVIRIDSEGPIKRRLLDMGVTNGAEVLVRKVAPFGDPIEVNIRGYELSFRKSEAETIIVESCDGQR